MGKKRGRKCLVSENDFINLILSKKEEILIDNEVADRNNEIWEQLSEIIDFKLSPASLYVMVKVNRYNIQNLLCNEEKPMKLSDRCEFDIDDSLTDISYESNNSSVCENDILKFDFFMSNDEFSNLIEYKKYECSKSGKRRAQKRLWCVFRAGVYQDFFIKKIWATTHLKCGFLFHHSYVNMTQTEGMIAGKS